MRKTAAALAAVLVLLETAGGAFSAGGEKSPEKYDGMRVYAENSSLVLYVSDTDGSAALKDKKSGYIWRSSPENVMNDKAATEPVKNSLSSSLGIVYAEPQKRSDSALYSSSGAEISVRDKKDGAVITYKFTKAGITIPVELTLHDDFLEASVATSDIKESKESRILTEASVMSSFGAASDKEIGYFVIPDGSGAIIRFNNGKKDAKAYSGKVYGNDPASMPYEKPSSGGSQVYFPMYGIVNGNNALMAVCTDGAACAEINAEVSGMSESSYNLCSFGFTLRGSDSYYMSGDETNALTVFESGSIKTEKIAVRYYPVRDVYEKGMDYIDIASAYRDYLTDEMNVKPSDKNEPELHLTMYGGVMKKRSFLGIPLNMRTSLTTYAQAEEIMENLKSGGVEKMSLSFNNWTDDGIKGRTDSGEEASSVTGGDDGLSELLRYGSENGFDISMGTDCASFVPSFWYSERSFGAVRISGEYAYLYRYSPATGKADTESDVSAVLSPSVYPELFAETAENYAENGIGGISLSSLGKNLSGDYGKRSISRDSAQKLLSEGFDALSAGNIAISSDGANDYVLPFADRISCVPLESGRYDIFDEDIPFYEIVLSGLRSMNTIPLNSSADSAELLLRAAAAGVYPHYEMIYEDTDILRNTVLDGLFYAGYKNCTDHAAQDFCFIKDVLSETDGGRIISYRQEKNRIYTKYENGTETVTDLENRCVKSGGRTYYLSDYRKSGE